MTFSFKDFEKDAWESKAGRYNDTWGTVTSQVIDTILNQIPNSKGKKILDLGCGPGHLCKEASLLGMSVVGADYSENMLDIASKNYHDLEFQKQDAEALTFDDNTFDVVVLNYLLLHVADQIKTLNEAKRILKKGGMLIYSNWLSPSNSAGLKLIFDALKEYADMTVIPPAQDIFMFSDFEAAKKYSKDQNFADVSHVIFETSWTTSDAASFYNAVQAGTRMGGLIDLQKPEVKEQIKDKLLKDIQQYKTIGGYYIPTPSIIVRFSLAQH